MNLIKRHKILSAIVGAVVVIIIAIAATAGGSGGGSTAPATHKPPAVTAPVKPKAPAQNERNDLDYFKIENKSNAYLTDIWVKWSVTNHSSKASDYWITWEALNDSGVRVADGSELTSNVQPGQTAKQDMPTTLTTSHVKLVVTKFDRTENFN